MASLDDDNIFDITEQLNFLFKNYFGVASTYERTPYYQEISVPSNKFLIGQDIFLDDIPDPPTLSLRWEKISGSEPTAFNLSSSDFATGGQILEDASGIIRKYVNLILDATPPSTNASYWKQDKDDNNVLADGMQFNYKWSGSGEKPYGIQLLKQQDMANEIISDATGGNWIYHNQDGVIFFPDYSSNIVDNDSNKPVFSFYKYIGRKGINKLFDESILFKENIVIRGTSTFESNIFAQDASFNHLEISGNLIIKDNLKLHGFATIYDKLDVSGVDVSNNLKAGTLNVTGNTTLGGTLDVADKATLSSKLDVSGVDVSNNLHVMHRIGIGTKIPTKELDVSGNVIISGQLDVSGVDVSNNLKAGTLNVTGNTTLKAKLDVSGVDVSNNLHVMHRIGIGTKTPTKELDVSGNVIISGQLDVSGVDVTGNTTLGGTLDVTNKATLSGQLDVSGVDVSNNLNVGGNLSVNGNLIVNKINYETKNINTTYKNTIINDNIITLGLDASNSNISYDTGFVFINNNTDASNVTLYWDKDDNAFIFAKTDSSGVAINDATLSVNRGELSDVHIKDLSANNASFNIVDISSLNINGLLNLGSTTIKTGQQGDIRYNPSTHQFEGYGNTWGGLGGVISLDQKTKITADSSGLKFIVDGSSAMIIKNNKDIEISGNVILKSSLDVSNNVDISGTLNVGKHAIFDNSMNIYGNLDVSGVLNVGDPSGFPVKIYQGNPEGTAGKKGEALMDSETNIIYINVGGTTWKATRAAIGSNDISGNEGDISKNFLGNTKFTNEAQIIYDTEQNAFYESSRSKTDAAGNGDVAFRELGYSFFRKNFEGSPPDPFFFFLTSDKRPDSITLRWTNPYQYPSGVSNSNETYLDASASTVNTQNNIYFPVVNRIMIQIKNIEKGTYETWGNFTSNTSKDIVDLSSGRCICSKHYPIPPYNNILTNITPNSTRTDIFDADLSGGRTSAVYELKDFANSITLYAKDYSPSDTDISSSILLNAKRVYPGGDKAAKELSPSTQGYEIKLWLENQYIKKDGTMTESDFNVIYLKDNNNEAINFLKVAPPSSPLNNDALIVFSDNNSNLISDVSDNNTIIELKIKDPSSSTSTQAPQGEDYNLLIKFIEIKFEYSNSSTSDIWTPCKKIYKTTSKANTFSELTDLISLDSSGVWGLSSAPLFSARVRDDGFHYYYIKLNNEFLGIANGNFQNYHKFRVSYKNGSQINPDEFGDPTESPSIQITEPPKPILSAVKMTAFDELTITLKDMSANLVDSSDNPLDTNNNRAVFLRDISFNITRQYGNENQISVIDISGLKGWSNNSTNTTTTPIFVSSRKEEKTSYIFTLPPGYLDPSETADLSYNFSLQIKNNINKKWSELSDELSIRITEPDMSNITINFTLSDISNNVLDISWNYPENGKRGIISSQTNVGLPKIQKFNLESTNFEIINTNGAIIGDNSHNILHAERGVDASNISLSFYSKVKAQGETPVNFDLSVNAYNEYINNFSSIFNTIDISASAPGIVQDLSALFHIIDGNQNFADISWNDPTEMGLTIAGVMKRNTIIQYDISATKISGNKYTPVANQQISYPTTFTSDVSNNDTTQHKTSMTDAPSKKKISNSSNSKFILPSSSYKIAIKATNSFGISGNWHDFPDEIKTDAPPPPN